MRQAYEPEIEVSSSIPNHCKFMLPSEKSRDRLSLSRQPPHNLLEHLPALLVILELIEAGAGGRQQNHIARHCGRVRLANRILQSLGVNDLTLRKNNLALDLRRRRPDRVHA